DKSVYNLPSSSVPCSVSISKGRGFIKSITPSCLPPKNGSLERFCSPATLGGQRTCSNPASTAPAHIIPRLAKSLRVSIVPISQPTSQKRTSLRSAKTVRHG